jgi:hypothetical protein
MEAWKLELAQKAIDMSILKDPQWLERLDEPMPVWAVIELVLQVIERLDPPSISYD